MRIIKENDEVFVVCPSIEEKNKLFNYIDENLDVRYNFLYEAGKDLSSDAVWEEHEEKTAYLIQPDSILYGDVYSISDHMRMRGIVLPVVSVDRFIKRNINETLY